MAILDSLKKEQLGVWKTNEELFQALRSRDTAALNALANVLTLDAAEQKELAAGEGAAVLTAVVADLRLQKGTRVAAARCCVEAGLPPEKLATLFLCAADLITDPRLGGKAKVLAEQGLSAAISKREDLRDVGQPAGDFARGALAAASVLGTPKVKEMLATAPLGHAGASAARFALGEELPPGQRESWEKVLAEQCAANRKAPAAAKRMGLAQPWPPFLPEVFAPLIKVAEEKTSGVATTDALLRPPPSKSFEAAPAEAPVVAGPQGLQSMGGRNTPGAVSAPSGPEIYQQRKSNHEYLGIKKMEPIAKQRSRAEAVLEEQKPVVHEPRQMPEIGGRAPEGMMPDMSPAALANRAAKAGVDVETLLETERLAGRLPASVLAALAADRGILLPDGRFYKGDEPLRFDPKGRRVPRVDRWEEFTFEWQDPVLPASKLKAPGKMSNTLGPFASRLKSLYEDRPEAVERLCAAAEARAAIAGEEQLLTELTVEMAAPRWKKNVVPPSQKARLRAIAADAERPSAWRKAAEQILSMDARPRPQNANDAIDSP